MIGTEVFQEIQLKYNTNMSANFMVIAITAINSTPNKYPYEKRIELPAQRKFIYKNLRCIK